MIHLVSSFVVMLAVAGVAQQPPITAPAQFAETEAPTRIWVAGVGAPLRQQILVDGALIDSLSAHSITSIAFRRDTQSAGAFAGGSTPVVVRLGISPYSAGTARADFAANSPNAVQVFNGALVVPASPTVPGYQGWTSPSVVRIQLTTPFAYDGGTLCIDIDASNSTADWWWPVDAVRQSASGAVASHGTPCGRFAWMGSTAWVAAGDLVPGNSVPFTFSAEPGHLAVALLGAGLLPQPVDLTFIGAAGCSLDISFFVNIPVVVPPPDQHPDLGGVASFLLDVPGQSEFLGAPLAVQWADIGLPLVTSNALSCTLASTMPDLGMSMVVQKPGDSRPRVLSTFAPVVRFESW